MKHRSPRGRRHGAAPARAGWILALGLCAAGGGPAVLVTGCGGGGGGGGGGVATAPLSSANDASRFLSQATFGPTPEEVTHLQQVGYEYWLEEQFGQPVTSHLNLTDSYGQGTAPGPEIRMAAWWLAAIRGQDQLRQRVAFALSQLLVVSDVEVTGNDNVRALAYYYDTLSRAAFGNYKELLREVSKNPCMGQYLSHVRNEKADAARNIRPDENYAREIMQLFSIGLVRLNMDGTPQLDGSGNPIPTYDQEAIEGMAAVFTGWTYPGTTNWRNPPKNLLDPMIAFEQYHDTNQKKILDGQILPAGQTAAQDLDAALEVIFRHQNVPPFISKHLIQRLVTSNPTPAYVQRVAEKFANDGQGIRGNLRAVIKAILLDPEARTGRTSVGANFGMLREPLLRQTALWRAFRASSAASSYGYANPEREFAQAPLRSPTVFNFFRPDYAQPGDLTTARLVSPEFQILTDATVMNTANRWFFCVFDRYSGRAGVPFDGVMINIDEERQLTTIDALLERLDVLLMGGGMSPRMRQIITDHLGATPLVNGTDSTNRVLEAIYLVMSSPEFQVQR